MVRRVACVFFCHRRPRCVTYLSYADVEAAAAPFLLRPLPAFKLRKIPEQTSDGMSGSPFCSGWSCVRVACCRVLVSEGSADPSQPVCCDFGAQSKKANDRGTRCGNNFACHTFRLARLQNRLVLPRHGERCLGASSSCAGDVLTRCYQGPGSSQLRVPQATRRSSFRSPFREERGKCLPRKMASANPTREANRSFQKQNFFFMFLAQSVGPYVCQIGPGPREICSNRLPQ